MDSQSTNTGTVCPICSERNGSHRADCTFATGTPNPQHNLRIVEVPEVRETARDHLAYATELAFNALLDSCAKDGLFPAEYRIPFEGLSPGIQSIFKHCCTVIMHSIQQRVRIEKRISASTVAGSDVEQLP